MADPVAMRRRLTVELRRLRAKAKLTQRQVATALSWSPSKIIRIEQGDVGIGVPDLWALLKLYDADDETLSGELTAETLEAMARGSKKLPLAEYGDTVSKETIKYFGYESSASLIRQVALNTIPGLLQTDAYATALFEANKLSDALASDLLASRKERRTILSRNDPPETFFIIDEGALHRSVGGPEVMRRQLDHLVDVAQRPTVSVQILPFAVGAHSSLGGPFILLEFPADDDPDVLYVENAVGDSLFLDEPARTSTYRLRFWELEDVATRPHEFAQFIGALRDDHS